MENAVQFLKSLPHLKNAKQQQLAIQLSGVVIASTIVYVLCKQLSNPKISNKSGYKEIPEPNCSYPYVGHMFSLGDLPAKTVTKWHAELGPIIKLRMGVVTWVIVDDPELAHKIFVTNGADTSHRPETYYAHHFVSKGGKKGIAFAQPGPGFKKSRAAALSVLSPKLTNESYLNLIKKESHDLITRLIKSSIEEEKDGIDPKKDLLFNSMNIIFSVCFGRQFELTDDPEFDNTIKMIEQHIKYSGVENELCNFLPILSSFGFLFTKGLSEMEAFVSKERDPIIKKFITEALACNEPNIVKSLEENGYDFDHDDDDRLAFMFDLIVAGTDTVAISLLWNFAILCHYPEIQAKICTEIDHFIKQHGRMPEFSDRTELSYCICVLKESMRYKPITAFGLPHTANKDVVVDGYLIPKGATLLTNMISLHRHPSTYLDPNKFNPDRFMNNNKTMLALSNGKFEERDQYNFGFGRRICPGTYMAEIELFYAFVQVFSRTYIEPVNGILPDIDSAMNGGITLNPLPYKVKFVKRQDAVLV